MKMNVSLILSSLFSAPVCSLLTLWLTRKRHIAEVEKMKAETESMAIHNHREMIRNVEESLQVLQEDLIRPLRTELLDLREELRYLHRALNEIKLCPMKESCPVSKCMDRFSLRKRQNSHQNKIIGKE